MDTISPVEAFESIDDYWTPYLAGEFNGQAIKLAKTKGKFVWHQHDDADEVFLVVSGKLQIEFRDRDTVTLTEGELCIVPRDTEHCPIAKPKANIILFEPSGTVNTGNVENERTQEKLENID